VNIDKWLVSMPAVRDDHGARVDSGRSLHFSPEQESGSIF